MNYWLMKTEPNVYSIQDLKKEGTTFWEGVRNYQVRNLMRDDFKKGDFVFIYHSNAKPPGIAGIGIVSKEAYADKTALDPSSKYYFPKATLEKNPWVGVEVKFKKCFKQEISLDSLKSTKGLENMLVNKKGMRLSVQPVTPLEWQIILNLAS